MKEKWSYPISIYR